MLFKVMDYVKENDYDISSINLFDPAFIYIRFPPRENDDPNLLKVMIRNDHLLFALNIDSFSPKNLHQLILKHKNNLL